MLGASLDQAIADDNADQERVYAIRAELETLAALRYTTDIGERFGALTEEWLTTDPYGMFSFLNEISADEIR